MTWFSEDCALSTLSSASRILLQRPPGLVPVLFRFVQCAAGVEVMFNGNSNRPGRGAHLSKGLECLQGGPVRRG